MPYFDHDYINLLLPRFNAIKADARPAWGTMTRDAMIAHLVESVRYSMGRSKTVPDCSSWFRRTIIKNLMFKRILPLSHASPYTDCATGEAMAISDDLEHLHALLEEYLTLVQGDDLNPPVHPYFGELGIDGWARLHMIHFNHHLRQFNV